MGTVAESPQERPKDYARLSRVTRAMLHDPMRGGFFALSGVVAEDMRGGALPTYLAPWLLGRGSHGKARQNYGWVMLAMMH